MARTLLTTDAVLKRLGIIALLCALPGLGLADPHTGAIAQRTHRQLRAKGTAISMTAGGMIGRRAAKNKRYGDSWTCRSSTRTLVHALAKRSVNLEVQEIGPGTFNWGKSGAVGFHYVALDKLTRPGLLVDVTASANFGRSAARGGPMHSTLREVARGRQQQLLADKLADKIANLGDNALVLSDQASITLYQKALNRAAAEAKAAQSKRGPVHVAP